MTPNEFLHTQRGGRLYFLWQHEKNSWKRKEYLRMFNEELKKINESIGEEVKNEQKRNDNAAD